MSTITWANGAGGNWGDAGDWAPAQVPDSSDTAEIGPFAVAATAWMVSVDVAAPILAAARRRAAEAWRVAA